MLEIRNSTEEDILLLEELYMTEIEEHEERATLFADDLVKRFRTLLAFKENKLCGTISWDTRGGLDDGVVELVGIGVNSSYQRQGVATAMVNAMTREAIQFYSDRGYTLRVIILFMEKQNEGARAFYKSIGFEESATLRELYPHDDGSIWMRHL